MTKGHSYGIIQMVQIIQIIQIYQKEVGKMQWKLSGKQDVYLEIASRYKEYILLGLLKEGEKLPSVRTAAGELGVNPNTVAKAYALLEEWGYICALPKKGAFVCYTQENSPPKAPDKEDVAQIAALKSKGLSKEQLLKILEEVYSDD